MTAYISSRQRQVWELQVSGLQQKEIAAKLGISVKTVEHLIHQIYRKLGINSLAASIHVAYGIGLVAPVTPTLAVRFGRQPPSARVVICLPAVRRDKPQKCPAPTHSA